MAAVCPEKGGTLQGNSGVTLLSQENEEDSSNAGLPSNLKQIQPQDPGAFTDSRLNVSGPATSNNHAEIDGSIAMPSIKIKEERIEDEEYIQISLNDVGEDSDESVADNGNEEEYVDVKLRRMRCQDCGQQFTHWEAFKIHQREHAEEEAEFKKTGKKRPLQSRNENEEKRKRHDAKDEDEEGGGGDGKDEEEDDDEFFFSACQIKPSEIAMVRPRVAMLSAEEKPVYGSSNQVYPCNICGKVYSFLDAFQNHQKTHDASEVKDDKQCPNCTKVFTTQTGLSCHMRKCRTSVVPEKPVKPHSDPSFNSTQTLLEHKECHKNKEFWCLSCDEGFEDAKSLDMHLLHHDSKRHRCDICFKSFRTPAKLHHHCNAHSEFKPYKCNFCYKEFPRLDNLITHCKRHLGIHNEGTCDQLERKSSHTSPRQVSYIKKLGAINSPGGVLLWTHNEPGEMEDSGSEDDHNEEDTGNNGVLRDFESGVNNKDSGLGSSANPNSMEDEEELVVVERTRYDVVHVEDEEEEEEEEDVVFTGQLSQPTQQQQGPWRCFECGASFFQEPELHLHYMKHASGEL